MLKQSLLLCFILSLLAAPQLAYAVGDGAPADGPGQEFDSAAVGDAIAKSTEKNLDIKGKIRERVDAAFKERLQDISKTAINIQASKEAAQQSKMPFFYDLRDVLVDRAGSGLTALATQYMLDKGSDQSMAGEEKLANGSSDGSKNNPYLYGSNTAFREFYRTYQELFCIPQGSNQTGDCAGIRAKAKNLRYENFIDFFVSDKTWNDSAVMDAMTLARQFFGSVTPDLDDGAKLRQQPIFFVQKQAAIARNNLRMGVLNYLASRRAPTSYSTDSILGVLFDTLASSGMVSGSDYTKTCKANVTDMAKAAPLDAYVCSFTNNVSKDGDQRIVSQSANDHIIQNDLMLSPLMFNAIQSSENRATGSIDKMNAYLSAVKVSQLYEQLQLIKMKTAVSASNLIYGN